jgi:hypothetical protein
MPNGGTHHCAHCRNFESKKSVCALRRVHVAETHWTSCQNFDEKAVLSRGPLYAIVCEVKDGGGMYATIPYWKEARPQMIQDLHTLDTKLVVKVDDQIREFETIQEYLDAHRAAGLTWRDE